MVLRKKYNVEDASQRNIPDKSRHSLAKFSARKKSIGDPTFEKKFNNQDLPAHQFPPNKEFHDDLGDESDESSTSFGICCWYPRALQFLAKNLWPFVVLFGLCGMSSAASSFFMRSQATSIERHLHISSSRLGVLMAANDIGSVAVVLFASHFGKNFHIPRLLALLALVSGALTAALALIQAIDPETLPVAITTGVNDTASASRSIMEEMMMNPMLLCMSPAEIMAMMAGMSGMGDPAAATGMPLMPPMSDPSSMMDDPTSPNTSDLDDTFMADISSMANLTESDMAILMDMIMGMMSPSLSEGNDTQTVDAAGDFPAPGGEGAMDPGDMVMDPSMMAMGAMGDAALSGSIHWGYYYTFVLLAIIGALSANRIPLQIFYVDTNVSDPVQTGMRVGILTTATMFGNPLSLLVGGAIGMLPVDLGDTEMSFMDSRWIGAWWLGFVIFGCAAIFFAIPVFCLPRRIRGGRGRKERPEKQHEASNKSHSLNNGKESATGDKKKDGGIGSKVSQRWEEIKDFLKKTAHILSNPVVLLTLFYSFTMILAVAGTMSFQFKYIENQFDMPAYSIALYLGIGMMLTVVFGTFTGGAILTRFGLTVSGMFRLSLTGSICSLICSVILIFVGCKEHEVVGFNMELGNLTDIGCQCVPNVMLVVCGEDGRSYLSPCLAGCTLSDGLTFSQCAYVGGGGTAVPGFCSDCNLFPVFMALVTLMALLMMITLTPQSLMIARLVPLHDQPIVTSLAAVVLTVGMLVGPIIFGNIYDSTCALWPAMGGPCVIPDKKALRSVFLASDAGIKSTGILSLIIAIIIMHCKKDSFPRAHAASEQTIVVNGHNAKGSKPQDSRSPSKAAGHVNPRIEVTDTGPSTTGNNEHGPSPGLRVPGRKKKYRYTDYLNNLNYDDDGDAADGKDKGGRYSPRRQKADAHHHPSMLGIFEGRPAMQMSNITPPAEDRSTPPVYGGDGVLDDILSEHDYEQPTASAGSTVNGDGGDHKTPEVNNKQLNVGEDGDVRIGNENYGYMYAPEPEF